MIIVKKSKSIQFFCILFALLLGLSACIHSASEPIAQDQPELTDDPNAEQPSLPQDITEENNPPEIDEQAPNEMLPEVNASTEPVSSENKGGISSIFVSETTQYWNKLKAVASAAQSYYDSKGAEKELISRTGKMYCNTSGEYISVSSLIQLGYLDSSYSSFSCDITLLKSSDVATLSGVSVSASGFRVYTATRQPNGNKYMISDASGKVGTVEESDFKILLTRYNQNHGTVGRLSPSSTEYSRIVSFLSMYEGKFTDYYIREIKKDNKYAVVTFSPATNVSNLKQYIMVNDNGFWEVVYTDIQKDYYRVQTINQVLPDFNMNLLTNYNLATWKNQVVADQRSAIALLINYGLVDYVENIAYQCGTADYCYFIDIYGNRFITYKDPANGNYFARAVSSDSEAQNYLINLTGVDYGFLLLDE